VAKVTRASAATELRRMLQLEANLLVAKPAPARPLIIVPPGGLMPGGGTCFVAASRCSEIPCVEFVGAGGQPAPVSSSVALERPITIPPRTRPQLGSTCLGHVGAPRAVPVGIP
jgi:hypothetical protein